MPDSGFSHPSPAELARQVRDVLIRFETLATKLETQFVQTVVFELYKQLIDKQIKTLEDQQKNSVSAERVIALEKRISEIEDEKKWVTRILYSWVIATVLGAVLIINQARGTG